MTGLQDATIARVLKKYGLDYVDIGQPQKGYRNQSFPIHLRDGQAVNLILYKREPGILEKIKAANAVSAFLWNQAFPVRHPIREQIIQLKAGAYLKYGALYNYLDGSTIPWEGYTQDHIKVLGKTLGDMHAALTGFDPADLPDVADEYLEITKRMRAYFNDAPVQRALADKLLLRIPPEAFDGFEQLLTGAKLLPRKQALHMDFVRSNILFEDEGDGEFKVKISGILDFEKTAYGHPLFDVARTLAFLLVDCKYKEPTKVRKYFLGGGYIKRSKATIPSKHLGMLDPLVDLFLFYDFYKFLRHNPYESLPDNEHFMRTAQLLIPRHLVVPTTSIAR
ncbi:MAG TPA: phosphotransferase [Candidatus Saccharimonadales bacterium]|nr:phosphotransferase [Candidatus Saccharimonadales bacterium]